MKKLKIGRIFVILILLSLFILISAISYVDAVSNNIADSVFRLHVIANSDSKEDQELKLKVRDELLLYMNIISKDSTSKQEAMRKNKKSCSISEFCRNNNFRTLEFYRMLSRHPELARKMKANSAGERVLDEEAMMTARAILRKEKIEDRRNRYAADAANEINTLAVQIEELRKEVRRLKCENQRLKKVIVSLRTTIRKQNEV